MSHLIQYYIDQFDLGKYMNKDLLRCLRLFQFPPQHSLYTQSQEQFFLYLLVVGRLQATRYHANGKVAVLGNITPLALIGDLEIFSETTIKSNVETLEHSTLLGVEKTFVQQYGANDPRFLRFVIHNLTAKLAYANIVRAENVQSLHFRLVTYLLHQNDLHGESFSIPPRPSLAEWMGVTVRHLNRVLKNLHDDGMIQAHRNKITILDRPRMEEILTS